MLEGTVVIAPCSIGNKQFPLLGTFGIKAAIFALPAEISKPTCYHHTNARGFAAQCPILLEKNIRKISSTFIQSNHH